MCHEHRGERDGYHDVGAKRERVRERHNDRQCASCHDHRDDDCDRRRLHGARRHTNRETSETCRTSETSETRRTSGTSLTGRVARATRDELAATGPTDTTPVSRLEKRTNDFPSGRPDDHVRNPPDSALRPCQYPGVMEDFESCYGALKSRDPRFDGWFFAAVSSTGIYCRPSCPANTPKRQNLSFYPTAAAAQQAGYRACMRCRPDAAPGSPEWLGRADVAARAVKLILLGTVDTEGVLGLASRLGYSERQLHRVLMAEVGTGALALARAQRAQTARLLLETTGLPVTHVAFAAGFASVRQFNDTVKSVFARTPSELRRAVTRRSNADRARRDLGEPSGVPSQTIALRLAYRKPFSATNLLDFLGVRVIPGVEALADGTYTRTLRLPNGEGVVALTPEDGYVSAVFALEDFRDLTTAVARCRQLFNLDSDPVAVDEALSEDPMLRPFVQRLPGLRVPGAADGFELATRALIGQQVSVKGARTIAGRLVEAAGSPIRDSRFGVTHTFPSPSDVAELGARLARGLPDARRAQEGSARCRRIGRRRQDGHRCRHGPRRARRPAEFHSGDRTVDLFLHPDESVR